MKPFPISPEEQISALLLGSFYCVSSRQFGMSPGADVRQYISVDRQILTDYLSNHPSTTEVYSKALLARVANDGGVEKLNDVDILYREGPDFVVAGVDQGKIVCPKRFPTLVEAVAEQLLAKAMKSPPLPAAPEDQIKAMLDGSIHHLARRYDVDESDFITVDHRMLVEYFSKNSHIAEEYFQRWATDVASDGSLERLSDVEIMYREGAGFVIASVDHGKIVCPRRYRTLVGTVADFVGMGYGIWRQPGTMDEPVSGER